MTAPERDHRWRDGEPCMDCGLDLDAMLADVDEHGHPTCAGRSS